MSAKIFRIALIGPESSGKTTLAEKLAQHFNTVWVPEFARTYIASLNRAYTYEDVLHCIASQKAEEQKATLHANNVLFADTELILHKIWLWDVFKKFPPQIDEEIVRTRYDLYLLTKPDLPFVEDPVRENPHRREYFYNLYKNELEKRSFPFVIIEGPDRFEKAVEAVKKVLPI